MDVAIPLLTLVQCRITPHVYSELVECCKVIADIQKQTRMSDEILLQIIKQYR
jgi:hypothetical protein